MYRRSLLTILTVLLLAYPSWAFNFSYGHANATCDYPSSSTPSTSLSSFLTSSDSSQTVTIPCGIHVIVDAGGSFSFPQGLIVDGTISFADGGLTGATTTITAGYILVRGYFLIGSEATPFQANVRIELQDGPELNVPNTSGNSAFGPAIKQGKKAFSVYGGAVRIYGSTTPSKTFAKLSATASNNQTFITVTGDVSSDWKEGDELAISRHTFSAGDVPDDGSSVVVVKSVVHRGGISEITLSQPLVRTHLVRTHPLTDGSGRVFTMAPSVVKLTRNIVVSGVPLDTDLDAWLSSETNGDGGHFVMMHTVLKQVVKGVEFIGLGQPGQSGRYPLHTHFLEDARESLIEANSVHHSRQRCYVVHATDNLTIRRNVAFRTAGHCYMIEDGLEVNNTFVQNIAISVIPAVKLITAQGIERQSDDTPAGFWLASPANSLVGNEAGGTTSFGIWFESFPVARGVSRKVKLPGYDTVMPDRARFGTVQDNEVYATGVGFATYEEPNHPPMTAHLTGLKAWTVGFGWQVNEGSNQVFSDAVMVDIMDQGIHSNNVENITVRNTVIVGQLEREDFAEEEGEEGEEGEGEGDGEEEDEGVERQERKERMSLRQMDCDPAELNDEEGRLIGILMENRIEHGAWFFGIGPIHLKNVHIQDFASNRTCRQSIGIVINVAGRDGWFAPNSVFESVTFSSVDKALQIDYTNETTGLQVGVRLQGSAALESGDGYLTSSAFANANEVTRNCMPSSSVAGMKWCAGECWRHVGVAVQSEQRVAVRVIGAGMGSFVEEMEKFEEVHDDVFYNKGFTKVLPAGVYDVQFMGRSGNQWVPVSYIRAEDAILLRPDETYGKPGCMQDVQVTVNGRFVVQAVPTRPSFDEERIEEFLRGE